MAWVTTGQAAKRRGESRRTVLRKIESGELRFRRIGHRYQVWVDGDHEPRVELRVGQMLSTAQAADRWGVTAKTARRWAAAGLIESIRDSRGFKIPAESVGTFETRQSPEPPRGDRARRGLARQRKGRKNLHADKRAPR